MKVSGEIKDITNLAVSFVKSEKGALDAVGRHAGDFVPFSFTPLL